MPANNHAIPVVGKWEETGRTQDRRGWFGLVILQVEQKRQVGRIISGPHPTWEGFGTRWIDADWRDYPVRID